MATAHFTLETTIPDTTFYITYGSMNCIKSKEVPESITETSPGSGKVQANNDGSCVDQTSKIHLYFWADPDHTGQLGQIKLYDSVDAELDKNYWKKDIQSVAEGYSLKANTDDVNEFTFTLSESVSDGA